MRPRTVSSGGLSANIIPGPVAAELPAHGNVTIAVSVVVPAYNNPSQLAQCLSALCAAAIDLDVELIVVDDASTEDLSSVASRWGARILRLAENGGPAAARNHGARQAHGRILFFVDADVVVAKNAIERVQAILSRPEIAAVFGSYDSAPAAPGLVSQYRNLLHHFVHQNGKTEAATFWAGCGAIRRDAFEHVGGFDGPRFPRPSIEDVELGYRLRRAGYRILLDKSLQATHLKRWTLWSVIRTDTVHRAIPWSRLIIERGAVDDLNLQGSQRACLALTGLACLFLLASPLRAELMIPAFACVAAEIFINRRLYAFFRRSRGTVFAAACVPLHLLYYVCCGVGYLYVRVRSVRRI